MGDRCFMQITCRRQDQERFIRLGFHSEYADQPEGPTVELIDEEANYAHYGELPRDIPYHGYHSAGGEYGSYELACDGQTYAEAESGREGDFVVNWDVATQQPSVASMEAIRRYLAVLEHATQLLNAAQPTSGTS